MPQRSRSHVVVPFEKLDMSRIVFTDAKANERGGKFVGIRYRDDNGTMKSLAVMYGRDGHKVPFGVSANYDQGASGYKDGKKTTSYSLNMSLGTKDNYNESPYFKKAQEFDQLMIDMCVKNSVKWTGKRLKRPIIAGDDEDEERIRGYGSLYKRMVKYSYKKNEDDEKVVNYDFAPGLVFGFKTRANDKTAADGTKEAYHTFITKFFDDNHQQVIGVDSTNVETVCPKRSEVKIVASWDSVYIGAAAISMKPKIIQIVVTPELSMENEDCLFGDGGFEEDGPPPATLGSGAGSGSGDASGSDEEEPSAPARRSRRSRSPKYKASPPPSGSEGEGEGDGNASGAEEGDGGSNEEEERPATPPRRRGGRRGRARRPRGDSSDEE